MIRRFLYEKRSDIVKFIHAADLHLESPFKGLKNDETPNTLWESIYNSTFNAFKKLVNYAISEKVDFVLLAGDLFDRDNQTPKTYDFFQSQMEKLNKYGIKVFIIYGNHDYLDLSQQNNYFPDNVYVFGNKVETKTIMVDDKKVAITGFSYSRKWINDKMIDDYPVKSNVDVQIGMLHGGLEQTGDNYAPFNLEDLIQKKYDYWALGHIHKRQQLNENPPIYYSGNIQGRHKNEPGDKGYLMVDTSSSPWNIKFHSTSVIDWNTLSMHVDDMDVESIKNNVFAEISKKNFDKMQLINLNLILNNPMSEGEQDNLIYRIQNELSSEYNQLNAWIYEINVELSDDHKFSEINQNIWDEAEKNVFENDNIDKLTKSLRKYDFIINHVQNNNAHLINQTRMRLMSGKDGQDED